MSAEPTCSSRRKEASESSAEPQRRDKRGEEELCAARLLRGLPVSVVFSALSLSVLAAGPITFEDVTAKAGITSKHTMGDAEMSKAKLRQLIFDYPSSKHVGEAQKKLAALEAK